MHVVVRNIGERIVASTNLVLTVLAVRDRTVLFGVEPVAAANPREEAAIVPPQEPNGPYRPSSC
jgi:sRNA-binding carbon storage regulator CsrA